MPRLPTAFSPGPHGALALLVLAYGVAVASVVPEMASLESAQDVLLAALPLVVLALGQSWVLRVAQIDLSVTASMSLASVLAAWVMSGSGGLLAGSDAAVPLALLVFVLIGLAVGVFVGGCTVLLGMPSFLVGLAVMMFLGGAALWFVARVAGSASIGDLPAGFIALGYGERFGVPFALLPALAAALIAHALMRHTLLGRWMTAVGLNAQAARVSGVPVGRVTLAAFALSGLYAGVGAAMIAARLETGTPLLAQKSLLLDIIGAAVIGGVSLSGGRGSVAGVLLGVLLLCVLDKGLQLLGLSLFVVLAVKGGVILLAAVLDARLRR